MPVTYGLPDADVTELLDRAMREFHPDLAEHGVRVGVLMAASDTDAPAVKAHGYAAVASVRVVPLKDRLTKGYDAELVLDRDHWLRINARRKLALLDHELTHLEVKRRAVKMPKGYQGDPVTVVDTDDLGRPKLRTRKGDVCAGDGFKEVVARHGDDADEFDALQRAYAILSEAKAAGEAAA